MKPNRFDFNSLSDDEKRAVIKRIQNRYGNEQSERFAKMGDQQPLILIDGAVGLSFDMDGFIFINIAEHGTKGTWHQVNDGEENLKLVLDDIEIRITMAKTIMEN